MNEWSEWIHVIVGMAGLGAIVVVIGAALNHWDERWRARRDRRARDEF